MKFILKSAKKVILPHWFEKAPGDRYHENKLFPRLRLDARAINWDTLPEDANVCILSRMAHSKSEKSRYLIGVDLRIFPLLEEDWDYLPVKDLHFEIYKSRIPYSFDGADQCFHFPHWRESTIWLQMKIYPERH